MFWEWYIKTIFNYQYVYLPAMVWSIGKTPKDYYDLI